MKKVFALLMTMTMVFGCFGTAYAAETKVTVNGEPVVFTDAKPFVDENGRTMVPLRPVANALGLEVTWDAYGQSAIFSKSYTVGVDASYQDLAGEGEDYVTLYQMSFYVGSKTFDVFYEGPETGGGWLGEMDTAAVVKDGRTYAPLRYLAEGYGYEVSWDAATSTVVVK